MPGNTFGQFFRLTTFGESHGPALGGIVDGCPAGIIITTDYLQQELDRRRPDQYSGSSPRKERDRLEILSGLFDDQTTGAPIAFLIRNEDVRKEDYDSLKGLYRASHGDLSWYSKYGVSDHRGGGRLSGRETAARVAGGAIAKKLLETAGIKIMAFTSQIGDVIYEGGLPVLPLAHESPMHCPDPDLSLKMAAAIESAMQYGDTLGGAITCCVQNCPAGLGEPVFDKLQADLARAVMSIGTAKAFEIGIGFASAGMRGSQYIDPYVKEGDKLVTVNNRAGGIQGGISTGEIINFRVAFSPVPSAMNYQQTIDKDGKIHKLQARGRHDVCIIPRLVPVVEAMTALVMADHYLRLRANKI